MLTGVTALLDSVTEGAEHALRLPVRIGVPQHVIALADLVASPAYAAPVGLVVAGAGSSGLGRATTSRDQGIIGRVRDRMSDWLREFF